MTRNSIVFITFVALAFVCFHQTASATFDLGDFIQGRIQDLITKERLTCSNYGKFCEDSNKQFETSRDPKAISANEMTIELCKAILQIHLCEDKPVKELI